MNERLIQELKDAGFPQGSEWSPSLRDLVDACGENFRLFNYPLDEHKPERAWMAKIDGGAYGRGKTHMDAVARLWLVLNK
tara:strand:- start:1525 stop:1764 length:240 start_codon:yes stop_codon:yes gene_type:complete